VELNGKVAVVTGASSGIGEGIARMLAREGLRTVLVARRSSELGRVRQDIVRDGGAAHVLVGDLRDRAFVARLISDAEQSVGQVDVLVNNAGVANLQPTHELNATLLDEELEVNLRAPALLCTGVLPGMRARRFGRIVNIASEAGVFAHAGMAAYSSTKRGLIALTEVIQLENHDRGVKAWAICPGMVDTPMGDDRGGRGQRDLFLAVEDVADLVRCLLHQSDNVAIGPEILVRTQRNPWVGGRPADWRSELTVATRRGEGSG